MTCYVTINADHDKFSSLCDTLCVDHLLLSLLMFKFKTQFKYCTAVLSWNEFEFRTTNINLCRLNWFRYWSLFQLKVAEHSFGSLWVYAICQIMAREWVQLTSWNLASEKYTDERFWLTGKMWRFCSFHGNMNNWMQP